MLDLSDILKKGQAVQDIGKPKKKKSAHQVLREKNIFRPLRHIPARVGPDQQVPSNEAGLVKRLQDDLLQARRKNLALQAQQFFLQKLFSKGVLVL